MSIQHMFEEINWFVWVPIIITAIVIVGAIIYFYITRQPQAATLPAPTPPQTPSATRPLTIPLKRSSSNNQRLEDAVAEEMPTTSTPPPNPIFTEHPPHEQIGGEEPGPSIPPITSSPVEDQSELDNIEKEILGQTSPRVNFALTHEEEEEEANDDDDDDDQNSHSLPQIQEEPLPKRVVPLS